MAPTFPNILSRKPCVDIHNFSYFFLVWKPWFDFKQQINIFVQLYLLIYLLEIQMYTLTNICDDQNTSIHQITFILGVQIH